MPSFDPTQVQVRPGRTLLYSDGAKETVIWARDRRLLVGTPPKAGVVNHFLYGHGLCYLRLWHDGLDRRAERDLAAVLNDGDMRILGDDLASSVAEAEAQVRAWGGETGSFALTHVSAKIARPDVSGAFVVHDLAVSRLSLEVRSAGPDDLTALYTRARAFLLDLLKACPDLVTLRITIVADGDESQVTAIVCPPLAAPAILIYGPRRTDAALLTAIG